MRLVSLPPSLLAATLGLWLGACSSPEESPAEAPEPAAEQPEASEAASAEPAVTPRRPLPVATEPSGRAPADELPPIALSEADQARANEAIALGGFALGQTLAQASARCTEVGGELTHVERTIHRCVFADRAEQPRTHVDVVLTPGDEPGPVGRIAFVYTSGAGEPLIPAFAGVTGVLFARVGPPRSRAQTPECAVATANLLKACLDRRLEPVEHGWSTGASPAGDQARMQEAGVEEVVASLQPSGQVWNLTVVHQAAGYTDAFVAAYQDTEE